MYTEFDHSLSKRLSSFLSRIEIRRRPVFFFVTLLNKSRLSLWNGYSIIALVERSVSKEKYNCEKNHKKSIYIEKKVLYDVYVK